MENETLPLKIFALKKAAGLARGTFFFDKDLPFEPDQSLSILTELYESKHINAWVHREQNDSKRIFKIEVSGATASGLRWLKEATS